MSHKASRVHACLHRRRLAQILLKLNRKLLFHLGEPFILSPLLALKLLFHPFRGSLSALVGT